MFQASNVVFFLVLLWWIANGLTSLYSKTEMSEGKTKKSSQEMKWLDLTVMQFLFGVIGSAFWIFFVERRSLTISKIRDWNGLVVILGNLVGHLSVNVSYTFVSSSATQVVKSSEPIFMFLFLKFSCLKSQPAEKQSTSSLVLFSIILMVFGTCIFVIWDIAFNLWGILAAVASNIAFPLRNIALKNIGRQYESPFEKYFILSFFGTLLLFPFLILKLIIQNTSPLNLSQSGIAASGFHCVYNLASISVLQNVSPLNHAILNFSKRIFVITLNIKYFNLALTWHMLLGLVIIFSGLALYLFSHSGKTSSKKFFIFPSLRITPRRCCRFFLLVGFLTLLSTLVYSPRKLKESLNEHPFEFDVRRVNDRPSPNPVVNRDTSLVLTTAWLFNKPMSDAFIKDMVMAHKQTGASIQVYCSTMKCLDTIKKLENPAITASFLVVPNVLGKTPLKEWGERHVLYKVLAGLHYEWYLTEALCLAHLWQYGGSFFLPSYPMTQRLSGDEQENNWPCMSLRFAVREKTAFEHLQLHVKDQRLQQHVTRFLENMKSWNSKPLLPSMFQDTVWNGFSRHCPNNTRWCMIRHSKTFRDMYARHEMPFEHEHHFGMLSFDGSPGPNVLANIGDEIQALAGLQFLPFVDFFLDREYLIPPNTHGSKHPVFFNAWWGNRRFKWPPPENIDPMMLSIHTDARFRSVVSSSTKAIDFLKSKAPIGARDMVTKKFMDKLQVPSFFSGCMTLSLRIRNPQPLEKRDNTIYITDLSKENMKLLPEWIVKKAKLVRHKFDYGLRPSLLTQERFVDAYKILEKYSQARLVITQRIHAALPCVAMGTPVIFFSAAKMPGGGVDFKSHG
jgi:drug/metabolite transporter (DMT)-like permease